ncbi:cbb3-type cytochrome oxidase assembly protein CcoS [Chelativorans sp. SCAU2101]|jgi:cbb3-type cytochrome oxidase maturation protein|uniref:Cbb3-type cytochrome oxidase assembly protein CcoS n=1 Tax=Chelativorans petroleitrophicus TaxID=2975484 RepID=A0A9X3B599_9HYPH|nr:cbb3-type cytochrome oxidase assembly protein CcoS [Chelativorans petroleitrophicus]MCT8988898.1 cbb3-type cytochrome oxidase assembly protein CcoS [Chelativorans petroleitrophicus]
MSYLTWLIPIALLMGATALLAFLWSLRDGQYEDLDGAAQRILLDDGEDRPAAAGGPRYSRPEPE